MKHTVEPDGTVVRHLGKNDERAAIDCINHVIECHLSDEDQRVVCVAMAFADTDVIRRALGLLVCNEPLDCEQLADRLRKMPGTIRALERVPS